MTTWVIDRLITCSEPLESWARMNVKLCIFFVKSASCTWGKDCFTQKSWWFSLAWAPKEPTEGPACERTGGTWSRSPENWEEFQALLLSQNTNSWPITKSACSFIFASKVLSSFQLLRVPPWLKPQNYPITQPLGSGFPQLPTDPPQRSLPSSNLIRTWAVIGAQPQTMDSKCVH